MRRTLFKECAYNQTPESQIQKKRRLHLSNSRAFGVAHS